MRENRLKPHGVIAMVLLLMAAVVLAGCTESRPKAVEISVLLANERGTYTPVTLVVPQSAGEDLPLVAIGHGFTGTMNSGGAAELAGRLAQQGIVSVRMDFNSCTENRQDSPRVNEYSLSSMASDMLLAVDYARKNYSIDETRIGLYARSMGGRVAMIMANKGYGGLQYKAMALVAPAGTDEAMIYYMGGQEKWDAMKEEAQATGFVEKQGLRLSYSWFCEFEEYDPAREARTGKNPEIPLLVVCNVKDKVVTAKTSKICAAGYEGSQVLEVSSEDGHGYEMSEKKSQLKEQLMEALVNHFVTYL